MYFLTSCIAGKHYIMVDFSDQEDLFDDILVLSYIVIIILLVVIIFLSMKNQ